VNEPPQSKSLDNLAMVSTSSPFRPPSLLLKQKQKLFSHTIRARRISLNINLSHSRSTPLAQFMAAITRYLLRIKFTRRRSLLKMQPRASLGLELIFTPPPPAIWACLCDERSLLNFNGPQLHCMHLFINSAP
jgi:hypothetical protein